MIGQQNINEQEAAINSILIDNSMETNPIVNIDRPTQLNTQDTITGITNRPPKRKIENTNSNESDGKGLSPHSKRFLTGKPLYSERNKGPFEVVFQNRNKAKLSPFQIGKILKNNNSIVSVRRTGKNITVLCKTFKGANDLVDNPLLVASYVVFIPTRRVQTVGVVYADLDVSEEELVTDAQCECPIINASRIKRRSNNELVDTMFLKLTFDSDSLPKEIKLNHVFMRVEPYMIPVKQCFRCFSFSHVASSPCNNNRVCRNCSEAYHSDECNRPVKCINCKGDHNNTYKKCPEYLRQVNIKQRMSLFNEDFFTASQKFPLTFKKYDHNSTLTENRSTNKASYSDITKTVCDPTDYKQYPNLPANNKPFDRSTSFRQKPMTVNTNNVVNSNNPFQSLREEGDQPPQTENENNRHLLRNPYRYNKLREQHKFTVHKHDHTYTNPCPNKHTQQYTTDIKNNKTKTTPSLMSTQSNREWLMKRVKAKIEELRVNLHDNCTKKEFEQLLETYLNEKNFDESSDDNFENDNASDYSNSQIPSGTTTPLV